MENSSLKEIKWKDIQIGDQFSDGSSVTQIHTTIPYKCYKITSLELFEKKKYETIVSEDHILLCNVSQSSKKVKRLISQYCSKGYIDLEEDIEIKSLEHLDTKEEDSIKKYLKDGNNENILSFKSLGQEIEAYDVTFCDENKKETRSVQIIVNRIGVKAEAQIINKDNLWLSIRGIMFLMQLEPEMKIFSGNSYIQKIEYVGEMEAFCVSTDSGQYKANGLIHHNSVALRNIIFHCITHSNEIQIALVDLKLTEFSQFKGMNGVVAVCNSVREAAEVLRIGRQCMYRRNEEMAKIGLTDVNDYKPHDATDKIWMNGREIQEDTMLKVRVNGEEKEMSAKEVLAFVEQ